MSLAAIKLFEALEELVKELTQIAKTYRMYKQYP